MRAGGQLFGGQWGAVLQATQDFTPLRRVVGPEQRNPGLLLPGGDSAHG